MGYQDESAPVLPRAKRWIIFHPKNGTRDSALSELMQLMSSRVSYFFLLFGCNLFYLEFTWKVV